MEDRLAKLLPPEIKVTHAHGQMTPSQLDKIMNDFYDGKIDVLLSTTIIESGIDIASARQKTGRIAAVETTVGVDG